MKSWQDWLKPPNLYYVIVAALLLACLYFFRVSKLHSADAAGIT